METYCILGIAATITRIFSNKSLYSSYYLGFIEENNFSGAASNCLLVIEVGDSMYSIV